MLSDLSTNEVGVTLCECDAAGGYVSTCFSRRRAATRLKTGVGVDSPRQDAQLAQLLNIFAKQMDHTPQGVRGLLLRDFMQSER